MEQREVDNMLLSMIQKHFPSLPLSDEYTDWGKWLGFARAVYESGRASPASAPEGYAIVPVEILDRFPEINPSNYDHDGACALNAWGVELVLSAAPTPPSTEDRWQPIATAPKNEFVLLAGPSGYTTIETVFATGRMCSDYHVGRWIDHANDDLTDWGFEPTHWMPLPKAPTMQEDKP